MVPGFKVAGRGIGASSRQLGVAVPASGFSSGRTTRVGLGGASRHRRARGAVSVQATYGTSKAADVPDSFWGKVKAAFKIFFPPNEEETARLEAKKRLRMILVADRCAMSSGSMEMMKTKIVEVVSEFVEVDVETGIEVNMTADPDQGTMYAVSIPVRRVKPDFDVENAGLEGYGLGGPPMYEEDDVWRS